MTTHSTTRIRDAFLQLSALNEWHSPYAVTLTMKQAFYAGKTRIPLDAMKASQNLTHFLNLLNAEVFSSAQRRKGARLRCIPVLEDDGVRMHYHLCLERPDHVRAESFVNLVHSCWQRTNFGYWMVDSRPCDAGWLQYMAKARTKKSFADSLDWPNFWNSASGPLAL